MKDTEYEAEQQHPDPLPPCAYCGGNGFVLGYENVHLNCKHCNGTGEGRPDELAKDIERRCDGEFIEKIKDMDELIDGDFSLHGRLIKAQFRINELESRLRGQPGELAKAQQRVKELEVAQKGNLARLDELNSTIKAIWEVLEIPSPLIFKELANNIPLQDFIKGLKQENNDLRKLTDELLGE